MFMCFCFTLNGSKTFLCLLQFFCQIGFISIPGTTFDVQLDEGSAFLDLGGAATRKLNLAAVDASVHIVFRAVNPIPLQEARVTITGETLVVDGILNARLAQMRTQWEKVNTSVRSLFDPLGEFNLDLRAPDLPWRNDVASE